MPTATNEAFNAIHDEAAKLLQHSDAEVRKVAELIMSLARYQHDVRPDAER
jgi:hypothetical protein